MSRGFFAVGIWHPKTETNVGTLWRSAYLYGASFMFTIGRRYKRQSSDTPKTPLHVPLFHFDAVEDLRVHLPQGALLVGVEMCDRARPLSRYGHPAQAVYLLGAEDVGLPDKILAQCHSVVRIECPTPQSMNVAVAGSIVMHDRYARGTCVARLAA